jgi:serine phosphatase RsbU (regulator of sigma subunit)
LVAIYGTVSERGLFGTEFDIEPLAMLLFTAALGWFVLTRAREQAYTLVALSRELQVARDIQQSLLPRQMPAASGLRIRGSFLPMSAVAGDFYDVTMQDDGGVVVIVADVSGHGVPAALVASMVKVAFAAEVERYDRPGDILAGINRALTGKFERAYVTACCVAIDESRHTIAYAAAGHPPPLLRRHDGRIERLEEGGIALALLPVAGYTTAEVPFRAGDRLLLFTDGLLEATRGDDGDFFGDAELARVVSGMPPSADLSERVLDAHRAWIGNGASLSDDVTLVVVERVG